ncbi:TetR/AcrR family transcriptional regulator [Stratiformator vulcanicus]|uniref:Fatty acid metabolism regulator protein n=1 Tax=Stratiformator vulcanicus TaxID=2527980 RepID=A0A517QVL5_9PLAN|nr:TetR/AcrR family transcriptional regulator [Stratiformator vulcanicus]QDT35661.1 Fatty acid metabolism regulator protein [Stratiformator vulcanicus]
MTLRSTRKQREFEQREALILDVARRLLNDRGYFGFNMDDIAAEIEYSKGTVYQHFKSKEDVLMGLAAAATGKRVEMFARAATFQGRPRERMTAIGCAAQLFVRLFPDHFRVEQVLQMSSIRGKTAEVRQEKLMASEGRCMAIIAGIIRDGIAHGDLSLPKDEPPENIGFGLWSLCMGGYTIAHGAPVAELGITDPYRAIVHNYHHYLDGIRWEPLSTAFDHDAVWERAGRELFSEEMKMVETAA